MSEDARPEKPTIAQLEAMLQRDDEIELEILPNGEVRQKPSGEDTGDLKPLIFRENLGGEYA
jgi:hypothetical protein